MSGGRPPDPSEPPKSWPGAGQFSEQILGGVSRAVRRSLTRSLEVAWPLDAASQWWPGMLPGPTAASWTESWREATRWWTGALVSGSRLGVEADARLLAELSAGLARAFRGRRIALEVCGRSVRAELDSIWLERGEDRYRGRVELRSIAFDGFEAQALTVLADDVAMETQPDAALVLSGVELRGHMALEQVIAGVEPKLARWRLRVAEGDLIEAARRRGGPEYLLDAAIREDVVEVELRAVRVRGVTVPCPRWLRLTRTWALAPLADGLSITDARRLRTGVEFRLATTSFRHAFDLSRVRHAILSSESAGVASR